MIRYHIHITGAVQGVGFRPFVYNLANSLSVAGNVSNTSQGVFIEAQQTSNIIELFIEKLQTDAPNISQIESVISHKIQEVENESDFIIIESDSYGEKTVTVLPDLATCPDCLEDIYDSKNRRYLYPFTNCTNCGPRFSIINEIPYDRKYTEMHSFEMCEDCEKEYTNPNDRRFHAQPNACPKCGPQISVDSIANIQQDLKDGKILALKGLGGYQLLCDASSDDVVQLLRHRKRREKKPFAIMVDSIETVKEFCIVSEDELQLLQSYSAPIVLLKLKNNFLKLISSKISNNNPNIGVMLPYTPLHHLLYASTQTENSLKILVCTSGNYHDEPISVKNDDAKSKLNEIADVFLHHNRPIARQVDDSVVRNTQFGIQYFRRARGYSPFSIKTNTDGPAILSVGAHLKNTISISHGNRIICSQHIGDLANSESYQAFLNIIDDLPRLYDIKPEVVVCDKHPDYLSSKFTHSFGLPVIEVQHHHAHIGSVMAENNCSEPVFGIAWDGTGFGDDNTIWGGEFLVCENEHFERWGHLQTFPLPGGDLTAKEPQRSALGLLSLFETNFTFNTIWSKNEIQVFQNMIQNRINSPLTSSIGRLFDGIASLLGLSHLNSFEGQSAMELEFIADLKEEKFYEVTWNENILCIESLLTQIINDIKSDVGKDKISAKFHNSLVKSMVDAVKISKMKQVAISGGVFQNKILFERSITALESEGIKVFRNIQSPTNDGGISIGQAYIASLGL